MRQIITKWLGVDDMRDFFMGRIRILQERIDELELELSSNKKGVSR